MDKKYDGAVDQAQIDAWKVKNPAGVWAITSGDKIAYFRKPNRPEMKSVATMGQTDPIGMCETLMGDTFLGGDRAILDDDDYFLGASMTYQGLVTVQSAELKKL
jgi:hypothetical protein